MWNKSPYPGVDPRALSAGDPKAMSDMMAYTQYKMNNNQPMAADEQAWYDANKGSVTPTANWSMQDALKNTPDWNWGSGLSSAPTFEPPKQASAQTGTAPTYNGAQSAGDSYSAIADAMQPRVASETSQFNPSGMMHALNLFGLPRPTVQPTNQQQSNSPSQQMQTDYQNFFKNTPVGQSVDWAGGKLMRTDSGAVYTDPTGKRIQMDSNSNLASLASQDPYIAKQWQQQYGFNGQPAPYTPPNWNNFTGPNGIPNYMDLANAQSEYNKNNAIQQQLMNNPDQVGPYGSRTLTMGPDGRWTLNTSLSPQLQQNFDQSNALFGSMLNRANGALSNGLSYNSLGAAPTFDTSKVPGLPTADANNLNTVRDSVYRQQTQYLDPQFQQGQQDLESKLTNQGIMPGSEAWNREMQNFNLTKQKAYGDARDSAIQAGGQEQSRLFGIGLQANQAGMNNAVAGFNAGMQGRQQGVAEQNYLHNAPINDIASLRGSTQFNMPSFGGMTGTSMPRVDYLNAANMGYNANLAQQNANRADQANFTSGLFGIGSAAMQSPWFGNMVGGLFGNNNGSYSNWLNSNSEWLTNNNMSPNDLLNF